ncbi:MAG: tRNA (adenine-N1)-methyltransferase [Anaerolineae bacterium]
MTQAQAGDLVFLVSETDRTTFFEILQPGDKLQTHRGILHHDDLIGSLLGSQVRTHLGYTYYLLIPTTDEIVRSSKRNSQIIYPKDTGYLIMRLGIRPGSRVLEAGTGSGGLTMALASIVGDEGHVYSYDLRDDMQQLAGQNLAQIGLRHRVTFRQGRAEDGFEETGLDAVIFDLRRPWEALDSARAALRGSGALGSIIPTNNQLIDLIEALDAHSGFGFIEAEELILRPYKTIPARVRPDDRIIGHTGFLVFGRAVFEEDAAV